MKGLWGTFLLSLCCSFLFSQRITLDTAQVQTYVSVQLSAEQLCRLSRDFSVDKIKRSGADSFDAHFCLSKKEYARFLSLGLPYDVVPSSRAQGSMANNYDEMVASWNRYPTYETYVSMLDTFRTNFPDLCEIETISPQTEGEHTVYAVHISNSLQDKGDRPSFFYSASIHGDEPVGYYLMLHLIHYLLNNYATDAQVRRLVDSVDIWICPLENPDGTYYTSNNKLGEYPYSIRYNLNYEDLNRAYPQIGQLGKGGLETEVQDMMLFGNSHNFTMSANFHGGSELVNYPWDTWTSAENPHADQDWWRLISRAFADSCHAVDRYYMTDESNGVTEGGDWYVIAGSRQDYFNYYQNCREMTVEVGYNKVAASSDLPNIWNAIRVSLLNYMGESLNGIRGVVMDSLTGEPIEARVDVANHDAYNSHVYSHLPAGDYHRPIKQGVYQVTYSAEGYFPKTLTLSVEDGKVLWKNVALLPVYYGVAGHEAEFCAVYPNPVRDVVTIEMKENSSNLITVFLYDITGRLWKKFSASGPTFQMNLTDLQSGSYFIKVLSEDGHTYSFKVMK